MIAALAFRLYLAGVFIMAAVPKILAPYNFALSVATYQILPLELVNVFALVVPWLELLAGVLLLVGFWTKPSALLVAGLMVLFTVGLGIALANGLDIKCGCFASSDAAEEIGYGTLVRDIVWLLMALFVLLCDSGRIGVDGLLGREMRNA